MGNEGRLRNEPNSSFSSLFSVCWYTNGYGRSEGGGLAHFANCFSGAGFTSTREGSRHLHSLVDQLKQIQQYQVQSLLVREGRNVKARLPEEIFQSLRMNFIP
jgi:hypothetical protein